MPKRRGHVRPAGDFTLRGGFRAGINEVEFVVENKVSNIFNPVMLRVEWDGTAARAVGR
jgi:hypothetical protein